MNTMTTVISVKTDKATKQQAQALAKQIGFPLSTLINAYLRDFVATGQVHFSAAEPMTPQMEKLIEQAEKEIAAGEVSPGFTNMDDFDAWLNNPESTWQNGRKIRQDLS